jgi:hypothetical protein
MLKYQRSCSKGYRRRRIHISSSDLKPSLQLHTPQIDTSPAVLAQLLIGMLQARFARRGLTVSTQQSYSSRLSNTHFANVVGR